ncbi:BNR/Asp-box repeat protein [Planctomycetes bacterium Poly30]|uniref:BNR/Asp-box repeat protein n=1 Tax=Saltatorellus ferox TaxID=2528018 RepID=A0A518F059_9BACT|nr:BNR/Asp-box repeat protein [Planctomycetes bacterium Poly30]
MNLLAALVLLAPAFPQVDPPVSISPRSDAVTLFTSPIDASRLFAYHNAAGGESLTRVFGSNDDGASFELLTSTQRIVRGHGVNGDGRPFLLTGSTSFHGPYQLLSANPDGSGWSEVLPPPPVGQGVIYGATVSASPGGGVWISRGAGLGAEVMRSDTDGRNWSIFAQPAASPCSPHAADPLRGVCFDESRVYETFDGGASWIGLPSPPSVEPIEGVAYVGDRVLLRTTRGVYSTIDAGTSWTTFRLNSGLTQDFLVDPLIPNRVLMFRPFIGTLESLDAGATWSSIDWLEDTEIESVQLSRASVNRTFVTLDGFGYTSPVARRNAVDGSFDVIGLPALRFATPDELTTDPMDAGHLVLNHQLESIDHGQTWKWKPLPKIAVMSTLANTMSVADAATDGLGRRLLAGSGFYYPNPNLATLFREEGGQWVDLGPIELPGISSTNGVSQVAVSETDPDLIAMAVNVNTSSGTQTQFVLTRDGGQTYEARGPLVDGTVTYLDILDGTFTPRILFVVRPCFNCPSTLLSQVFISDDSLASYELVWADDKYLYPARSRQVSRRVVLLRSRTTTFDPGKPLVVSNDGGSTWTVSGANVEGPAVAIHPTRKDTIVCRTAGSGAQFTEDGGATWTLLPGVPSGSFPGDGVEFSDDGSSLYTWSPGYGLQWFELESRHGDPYCGPAAPNASGNSARLELFGPGALAADEARLRAYGLPVNTFGYFVASDTSGFVAQPGGSFGNLCLGGAIGRYSPQVASSGAWGCLDLSVLPSALPTPTGFVSAASGQPWYFQCWFRDSRPGTTASNFTDAVSATWF